MKIIKIGTWDKHGWPIDWYINVTNPPQENDYKAIMTLASDGRVFVDRVEIVEWTVARRMAMADYSAVVKNGIASLFEDMTY